ncbi:establishment of centrosome localization [Sparganum proliferum]
MRCRSVSQPPRPSNVVNCKSKRSCSGTFYSSELVETSQILVSERSNVFRYRQFYSLLKFAHKTLQNEYLQLEHKFAAALLNWAAEKVALTESLHRCQADKSELAATCEILQKNGLTKERLDIIKLQVANDFEQKSRDHLQRAQLETEAVKSQLYQLQTELAKLQAENEQLRIRCKCEKDKENLVVQTEKRNLCKSHEEVISRLSTMLNSDTESMAGLYQESMQIRAKCGLLVEEISRAKVQSDQQTNELRRDLIEVVEQLSKAKSDNGVLLVKQQTLSEQVRILRESVLRSQTELTAARQKVLNSENARLNTEKQLEAIVQRSRIELADLRVEAQRQRVDIERQRDELAFQVQELTNQAALAFARFDQVEEVYLQRERSAAERENEIKQVFDSSAREVQERMAELAHQLSCAQNELIQLSSRHRTTENALAQSDKICRELTRDVERLRECNANLTIELRSCRLEMEMRGKEIRNLESALQEFTRPHVETTEGEDDMTPTKLCDNSHASQLRSIREAYGRTLEKSKKQKRVLTEKLQVLTTSLENQQTEMERLRLENLQLRNRVPQTDYLKLKAQLLDLHRRSEEYGLLLKQSQDVFLAKNAYPERAGDG